MIDSSALTSEHERRSGPATREPKTHNHLIGDPAALEDAWERDGYWFFRDVLDTEAVARLRRIYTEELEKLGVIDPVGDAPTERGVRYNGASLADFPPHMEPLAKRKAWNGFVAEKPIHDFFARLLDDEPFWVPFCEYRATPPCQDPTADRLTGIHQDGPNTPGVPFRVCWVPVVEIDEACGGVVFAEGITEPVNRHGVSPSGANAYIALGDLPPDCWRRTTYRPGDVLLMNRWTPHSGLTNLSDRFRMSFDQRLMGRRDNCPIVGQIVSITPDRIEVQDADGVTAFQIVRSTFVRNEWAERLHGREIAEQYAAGAQVIVGHEGGIATVVRPVYNG